MDIKNSDRVKVEVFVSKNGEHLDQYATINLQGYDFERFGDRFEYLVAAHLIKQLKSIFKNDN